MNDFIIVLSNKEKIYTKTPPSKWKECRLCGSNDLIFFGVEVDDCYGEKVIINTDHISYVRLPE